MKILKLQAENVKRLKAIEITPDGAIVQITGRNAQGKSSVLDSIAMALGGKEWQGAQPIRNGADKGKIVVSLDNGFTVTRTLTPTGGTLTLTNADGAKYGGPQDLLNKVTGELSFDPLAFVKMKPKDQASTLRALVKLDLSDLDAMREGIFADRTEANRTVKALESQVAVAKHHADVPAEEVSVASLVDELGNAESANRERAAKVQQVSGFCRDIETFSQRIETYAQRIAELTNQRNQAEKDLEQARQFHATACKEVSTVQEIDVLPIRERISGADAVNRKVRENRAHAELEKRLADARTRAENATGEIARIDAEKQNRLAAAKFPVDGLAFDADGVTYNGVPFSQASSAEQLRVSVSMGIAMNPKLKVILIRDGSLLDKENLRVIGEMAEAADAQIWIEMVDESGKVGIVIEDGQVQHAEEPAAV